MASIHLRGLRKSYKNVAVLHGIDLDIEDGEFVVLVGPSGCGKSTLLRSIAGLEDIHAGEIRIGERVVNHLAPRERDIAMVFQNYALYPHMTVAENMTFALRLTQRDAADIQARLDKAAAMLGLSQLLERYPRALSGGQRQRVAMGRAIVRQPQAFLFDEPLSNLDAQLRVQMRADIKALHQELGTTSVYVTHDQIEAMTMADRIVVLRDGRIEQVGAPLDLYDRPANKFVAGFIGSPSMNFLPATLQHDARGTMALLADGQRLHLGPQPCGAQGQAVWLGFRPEHLSLCDASAVTPERAEGLFTRLRVLEPTGAASVLILTLGGVDITAELNQRLQCRPGDALCLRPDPALLHLFDRQSEQALVPGTQEAHV